MNPQDLSRLKEEQEKAIRETDLKLEKWERFKSDYVALKTRLKTLPDKVSHDVMVPFGSLAFMPGKLVHTNEILVLLGDNWFAERSAKQAAAIVDRRLKDVESQIKGLQEQKKMLAPRLDFTSDLDRSAKEQGMVDITEEYDERKEKHWKEQHRKRAQQHRKNESEGNVRRKEQRSQGHKEPMTDEQLWARLDELERIETERNELQMLDAEDEIHLSLPSQSDDDDDGSSSSSSEVEDSDEEPTPISRITFTHTKVEENTDTEKSGTLVSPRDIYKQFCDPTPKSILKTDTNGAKEKPREKKKVKMKENVTAEESRRKRGIGQGPLAFSGTVVEKNPAVSMTMDENNSDKTVLSTETVEQSGNRTLTPTVGKQETVSETEKPKRVSKFKAGRQRKT